MYKRQLYDYLDDNPACMAAPISYTNDIRTGCTVMDLSLIHI